MSAERVNGSLRIPVRSRDRWFLAACAAMLIIGQLAPSAAAQAGSLDVTFSEDGFVATDFSPSRVDFAYDVAISELDGSIVAVGRAGGSGGRFGVARYTSEGTLDAGFGIEGKALTDFTSGTDAAYGVAIQADGKIVAAGRAEGHHGQIALARYDSAGELDPTFGGDGKVITNLGPRDDYASTVAIQADGRILVGGGAGGTDGRFMLARYDTDGALDATFGDGGAVFTNFTERYDYVEAIALQDDGKIVAVGSAKFHGANSTFAIARYTSGGILDDTFAGDGKLRTRFAERGDAWAYGVAIQPDDAIVVAGQAEKRLGVARYDASGALDPTFSDDGRAATSLTPGFGIDQARDVVLQDDGKIVAVGSADAFSDDPAFALVRYHPDGSLDTTFDEDGKLTTNPSTRPELAFGVALQPSDGKIVVAGRTGGSFAVARYLVA